MEAWKASFVVFGLILFFGVQSGSSIKCYECNSAFNHHGIDCEDTSILRTRPDLLKDCDEKTGMNKTYIYCRIYTQHVMDDSRIIRQCASGGRTDKCIDRTGTKGVKMQYCHCDVDGCNTGASLRYTTALSLASIALTLWQFVSRT